MMIANPTDYGRTAPVCKPVSAALPEPADATTQAVARALLDEARQHYLTCLHACVVAGIPHDEMAQDEAATHRAAAQMLAGAA